MLNSETNVESIFDLCRDESAEWKLLFQLEYTLVAENELEDEFVLTKSFIETTNRGMEFRNCRVSKAFAKWLCALRRRARSNGNPGRSLSKPYLPRSVRFLRGLVRFHVRFLGILVKGMRVVGDGSKSFRRRYGPHIA